MQDGSKNVKKYYVSRNVVREALRKSKTYESYATAIFDDFFDHDVALHSRCDGPYLDVYSVEALLATLPQEPLDVLLGIVFLFLRFSFLHSIFPNRPLRFRCEAFI